MSDERERPEPLIPYRWIYFGLGFSIAAQLLIVWFAIDQGGMIFPAGNVATAIICAGAIWLIRQRQKGRL